MIDRYPSPQVGVIYCVGTRAEAGGSSLVLDELNHFGRKDRLFLVQLETVGFSGCINPDHIPEMAGDADHGTIGTGYSVGYLKAMTAALAQSR
jgi:mannonate dehydratase